MTVFIDRTYDVTEESEHYYITADDEIIRNYAYPTSRQARRTAERFTASNTLWKVVFEIEGPAIEADRQVVAVGGEEAREVVMRGRTRRIARDERECDHEAREERGAPRTAKPDAAIVAESHGTPPFPRFFIPHFLCHP